MARSLKKGPPDRAYLTDLSGDEEDEQYRKSEHSQQV